MPRSRVSTFWWVGTLPALALFAVALGWVLIGRPREDAQARAEGAALAQACLQDLRRQHGNTPPLLQAEAQTLQWSAPGLRGERRWTLSGTLRHGQDEGVFDCDGVQEAGGQLRVTYAFGSPWWTPPPD